MLAFLETVNSAFEHSIAIISWIALIAVFIVVMDNATTPKSRLLRLGIGFLLGALCVAFFQAAYWLCLQGNPNSPTQSLECMAD